MPHHVPPYCVLQQRQTFFNLLGQILNWRKTLSAWISGLFPTANTSPCILHCHLQGKMGRLNAFCDNVNVIFPQIGKKKN